MSNKRDAEYNAMRRRMSRLRVQQGKTPSLEAEDVDGSDPGFRDLMKYWKKHGIPIAKGMVPDLLEEEAKHVAKARGRRKSRELEDLDLNTKTGKLKLKHPPIDELGDRPRKPTNHISHNKKMVQRTVSEFSIGSKSSSTAKTTNGSTSPTTKKKFVRAASYKT